MRHLQGPRRRAACLGVLCMMLPGLFAFPTSAGQDPYHIHIVVGGTRADRARALASHLLRERKGIDDAEPPTAPSTLGRTGSGVRVFSLRGNDDGGPAVLSLESGGAILQAAVPQVPVPSQTDRYIASPLLGVPQTALATPDPPPRPV